MIGALWAPLFCPHPSCDYALYQSLEKNPHFFDTLVDNPWSSVLHQTSPRRFSVPVVSVKPSKARYDPRLERVKIRIRRELQRPLTEQEERLIELSVVLEAEDDEENCNDAA